MTSATIKIFLVFGNPKRLRTAEISNWTGKAVAGPRSEFDSILDREESQSSGVYLLAGNDVETGKSAVYIGEAESVRDRLRSHLGKDFWNQVVFFTSKDENLTKAHARYLEGMLIKQVRAAARCVVKNGQSSGSKLPESDREDMNIFLEKMHQLLPVLGVDLLAPDVPKGRGKESLALLFCEIKGIKATGYLTPSGLLVLKGSQAVAKERPSSHRYPWPVNMRKNLLAEGVLESQSDCLVFTKDAEFSSPSAAAAVIHGGHVNGLTAWRNKKGVQLKELQAR